MEDMIKRKDAAEHKTRLIKRRPEVVSKTWIIKTTTDPLDPQTRKLLRKLMRDRLNPHGDG
jgi:hypothetical protein